MPLDSNATALWERYERALQYELRLQEARDDFLVFCEMMMPGNNPDDPFDTKFIAKPHHRIMAKLAHAMIEGKMTHILLSMPPRHGKTWVMTTMFSAWFMGRNPHLDVITSTYNSTFAEGDFSNNFKEIVTSHRFSQVFPDFVFDPDQNAADHRKTMAGGNHYFVGRRTSMTGRGGDLIIVDDPFKDDKEARLQNTRDDIWSWFTKTLYTRRHNDNAPIILTATRWIADDIIGRISDPANVYYSEEFAEGWHVVNIPAIATKEDILQREPGEALWPEKFSAPSLLKLRAADPVGFSCLYQGDPIPDGGVMFQPEDLTEYDREEYQEVKKSLRMYCFSDHAYGVTKTHDPSCFAPVGVAGDGTVYFMPDIFWERAGPEECVEAMLDMMRRHRPMLWVAENGAIYKALEPFLKKRMAEERVFCPLEPIWPKGRKIDRLDPSMVQGAMARCRMGKVKFPSWAPWWPRAKAELLQFPNGAHDDFVDVLSLVGSQIDRIYGSPRREVKPTAERGTYEALYGRDDEPDHNGTKGWTGRVI